MVCAVLGAGQAAALEGRPAARAMDLVVVNNRPLRLAFPARDAGTRVRIEASPKA